MGLLEHRLKNKLVMYWRCDEALWDGTADEIKDLSIDTPKAHGYAINGLITATGGKLLRTADCAGAANDDYARSAAAATKVRISGDLSLACWFNSSNTTKSYMTILHNAGYAMRVDANVLAFFHNDGIGGDEQVDSTYNTCATGAWKHLCIVSAHPSIYYYVNGVLVDTKTSTFANVARASYTQIGHANTTLSADGKLDECAVWSRALDADEVEAVYNGNLAKQLGWKGALKPLIKDRMTSDAGTEDM